MADEAEQSVAVDTDAVVTPPAEESSAQDLDALLDEFESGVTDTGAAAAAQDSGTEQTTAAEGQGEQPDDVKAAVDFYKAQQAEDSKRRTDETINKAADSIEADLETKLPKSAIKGVIYEKAESDPRFLRAFQQREQHPEAWNKILKAVASGINKEMADSPDPGITDDRRALASAVQSASSTAPGSGLAPNFGAMSDADLAEHKRQATRASR